MIDIIGLVMLAEGEPKPNRRRTEATCGAPVARFGAWVCPLDYDMYSLKQKTSFVSVLDAIGMSIKLRIQSSMLNGIPVIEFLGKLNEGKFLIIKITQSTVEVFRLRHHIGVQYDYEFPIRLL